MRERGTPVFQQSSYSPKNVEVTNPHVKKAWERKNIPMFRSLDPLHEAKDRGKDLRTIIKLPVKILSRCMSEYSNLNIKVCDRFPLPSDKMSG